MTNSSNDNITTTKVTSVPSSTGTTVACLVTMGVCFALQAPFLRPRTLPFMATPANKVARALARLPNKKCLIDLGSGDGQVVYEASKLGYERVVGVEINTTLYLLSQVRRIMWTSDQKRRATFVRGDFLKMNLQETDTVFLFGVRPLMKPLSQKIATECKVGTHILSYRFALPTYEENVIGEQALVSAEIIYDEEELRVYKVMHRSPSSGE